jgi:hypothetical protein
LTLIAVILLFEASVAIYGIVRWAVKRLLSPPDNSTA